VPLLLVANLPLLISGQYDTSVVDTGSKFAASMVDNGGKFAKVGCANVFFNPQISKVCRVQKFQIRKVIFTELHSQICKFLW
jgi:hypothetical protein